MEKCKALGEHLAGNDGATGAGWALMAHIEGLGLHAEAHNRLVELIDAYREECEQGAYVKGAIEKPRVVERCGKSVTQYN